MINHDQRPRVLIVGLDGATFHLLQPLIEQNKLPFFHRLLHEGSSGVLDSDLPVNSAANWASLFSGKNPGKHNIYDYLNYGNGSYQPQLIQRDSFKTSFVWNIANDNGLRIMVLNAPISAGPEPLNGIMVSGLLTPANQRYAYPDTIAEELEQQGYPVDCGAARRLEPEEYFTELQTTLTRQVETFSRLLRNHPWDLAVLTLNILGKAQHDFWHESNKIETLYMQIDDFLKDLYSLLDEESYFMVVSHHGFKSVTKKFFVNEWLWELGLLKKKITINPARITDVHDVIYNHFEEPHAITRFLARAGITKDHLRSILPDMIAEYLKRFIPWGIKKYFPYEYLAIDWAQTQAYFISTNVQGININLQGREPQGIVTPGQQYERLRDKIIGELYRLKDPYTLEDVVDEIYRREDVFKGDYVQNAPDIIFVPHQYNYYLDSNKRTSLLCIGSAKDDYPVYAYHEPRGIFFITGPDIKKGKQLNGIDIYDVAPTVLHLLGLPIPRDFDGRVLSAIFQGMNGYIYQPHPQAIEDNAPLFPLEFRQRIAVDTAAA
ncbi:MAG: alkaline phosphatase family protein [candidate division KSB1 bacterium]|nr:alkaline phosphatase family protein [candidate division KSB1 bacterium]